MRRNRTLSALQIWNKNARQGDVALASVVDHFHGIAELWNELWRHH